MTLRRRARRALSFSTWRGARRRRGRSRGRRPPSPDAAAACGRREREMPRNRRRSEGERRRVGSSKDSLEGRERPRSTRGSRPLAAAGREASEVEACAAARDAHTAAAMRRARRRRSKRARFRRPQSQNDQRRGPRLVIARARIASTARESAGLVCYRRGSDSRSSPRRERRPQEWQRHTLDRLRPTPRSPARRRRRRRAVLWPLADAALELIATRDGSRRRRSPSRGRWLNGSARAVGELLARGIDGSTAAARARRIPRAQHDRQRACHAARAMRTVRPRSAARAHALSGVPPSAATARATRSRYCASVAAGP